MDVGTELVLKRGFSQGSSDTVTKILHKKIFSFMGLSQVLLKLDITILLISSFVFTILYAIVMQMMYNKTINTVLFGFGDSMVKVVVRNDQIVKISNFMSNTIHR